MTELYTQHFGNGWGLLFVYAKNAFNMVNRVDAAVFCSTSLEDLLSLC